MTDTLGRSEFRDACLSAERCPFCVLRQRNESRYFRFFLGESVNDGGVNERLWKSYGFCRRHAAQLKTQGDGMGAAIVYERVLHVWQEALDRVAGQGGGGQAGVTHFAQRLLHSQETAGMLAAEALEPTGLCPACASADQAERFLLSEIGDLLEQGDGGDAWHWLGESFGICLPHFRSLVSCMHEEAAIHRLCDVQKERIVTLRGRLEEYVRKHDYRFVGEAYTDAERTSWSDAIALLVGAEQDL